MPLDQRPLEKVSQAVSVACVGQEVEPPSIISLELAPEDNSSTLVLGLASDGHLAIDISEYLVPSMNQAVLRCIASNGEGSSQTKQTEIKLDIIRKLALRLLQNLVIFLRSSTKQNAAFTTYHEVFAFAFPVNFRQLQFPRCLLSSCRGFVCCLFVARSLARGINTVHCLNQNKQSRHCHLHLGIGRLYSLNEICLKVHFADFPGSFRSLSCFKFLYNPF